MTWCIEYRVECVLLLIHSCTSVCSITWFESTRHSYILPYPGLHYHCLTLIGKSWICEGLRIFEGKWSNHTELISIDLLQCFLIFFYNTIMHKQRDCTVYLPSSSWFVHKKHAVYDCMLGASMGVYLETGCWCKIYVCLYDHTTLSFHYSVWLKLSM